MNDTERLDAIGEYGLCIAQHQQRTVDGWSITWIVQYGHFGDRLAISPDIREAIDAAVLDLTTNDKTSH